MVSSSAIVTTQGHIRMCAVALVDIERVVNQMRMSRNLYSVYLFSIYVCPLIPVVLHYNMETN